MVRVSVLWRVGCVALFRNRLWVVPGKAFTVGVFCNKEDTADKVVVISWFLSIWRLTTKNKLLTHKLGCKYSKWNSCSCTLCRHAARKISTLFNFRLILHQQKQIALIVAILPCISFSVSGRTIIVSECVRESGADTRLADGFGGDAPKHLSTT